MSKIYIQTRDSIDTPSGTEWLLNEPYGYLPKGYSNQISYGEKLILSKPEWFKLKEPERWRPKYGEIYWYPTFALTGYEVNETEWKDNESDKSIWELNICFKNASQCQEYLHECKELAMKKQEEFNNEN